MTEQPSGQQEMQSNGPHQNAGTNTAADAGPNVPAPADENAVQGVQRQQEPREEVTPDTRAEHREGGGTITRDELERILADREAAHREELQAARAGFPSAQVPAHSGGPGADNHQRSWSLVEQEAALRGETLDHWDI